MREFKIPVEWAMCGIVKVQANSLEEAVEYVKEHLDDIDLPDGDYIDSSFQCTDDPNLELAKYINKVNN